MIKHFRNSHGQALVEAALITPLIVFFLFTIIWFAKIMITWQQLVSAARYGTDLIAYTPFSSSYIKRDITDYLCSNLTVGRRLDSKRLTVEVKIYDIEKIDYSLDKNIFNNFNPSKLLNSITSLNPINPEKSYVEVSYLFKTPKILKIIGKDTIVIKSRSQVLTGNGSVGSLKREK